MFSTVLSQLVFNDVGVILSSSRLSGGEKGRRQTYLLIVFVNEMNTMK